MYKNVKLLTKDDKNLKVDKVKGFRYAKELNQCIVTVDEFFKVAKSQPIVFAKGEEGSYFSAAILGIEEGKNAFVNGKGEWAKGEYVPAYVRRYPFIFVQQENVLALAYDADCKEINEKKGQSFFDKNGSESEYVKSIMKFMEEYQKSSVKTSAFIQELEDMGLLEDANATITIDGKQYAYTGFKRVNEEKLDSMDEKDIMKLIKSGSYKLILAHLISMSNFEKLISLQK